MYRLITLLFFWHLVGILIGQDVHEEIDTIAFSVNMDNMVITGQYRPTHYKNVVHNIEVIDKKTIQQRGALTLKSAISISPSIRLYEDPILGTSIKMRGISSSNVAILIDGVPVIGRQNGSIDLSQISMQNVERIEVVEGPLSNIYGSNAAGGVINIITKKSQIKKYGIDLESQIESIGIRNHQANLGYKKGRFNFRAYGRIFKYDQFPSDSLRIYDEGQPRFPFNPKDQIGYGGLIRYDFNEDNHLILKYDGNNEKVKDLGIVKRPQFNPYANDFFYNTARADFASIYKGKINEKLFIDVTAAYNQYDRVKEDKRYFLESQEFGSAYNNSDTSQFKTYFGRINTAYVFKEDWSLMSGVTFNREQGSGDRIISPNERDTTIASSHESAIYSELTWKGINDLQMIISGRWTIHSIYKNRLTPSFQWKYKLGPKWSLKGGYAQGYRSPSLKELYLEFIDINHNIVGNSSLEPEISHDIQGTLTYQSKKRWSGGMNVYFTQINNRINLTETESLKFIYDNIDQYQVYGFQPNLAYELNHLKIQSSASLGAWSTNIENDSAPNFGNVCDMNNSINFLLPNLGLGFLLNHRHIGAQPIFQLVEEEVVISRIERYNMLDFTINKTFFKDKFSLVGGAKNILNVQNTRITNGGSSVAHSSSSSNAISQGRSWFLQLRITL